MSLAARLRIAWVCTLLALLVLLLMPDPTVHSLRALAVVIGLTGVLIFAKHGGRQVTVTGLFGIGVALVMSIGGWLVADVNPLSSGLYTALAATALGLSLSVPLLSGSMGLGPLGPMPGASRFVWMGISSMVALLAARDSIPGLVEEGAAFMSVVVFAVGVIFMASPWSKLAPLLVLPHLLAYSEMFHGSTGRLRLVALAGALVLLYTARHASRWHKPAILLVTPFGLAFLARDRVAFQLEQYGWSESSGLESLLAAPRAFALLIDAQAAGREPLHYGASFLSPLTSLLPDWLHLERMPGSVAYELARWTDPNLYGTGFSTAGTYFGEWWWNFGAFGIVLAVLVTGPALGLLERWVGYALGRLVETPRAALIACAAVGFGGGVIDLAWGGPHTWLLRGITRLPLLLVLFPLVPRAHPESEAPPVKAANRARFSR